MNAASIIDLHDGDLVALIDRAGPVTYRELRERVAATAAGLIAEGLEPGDRVAIIAGTDTSFVVSLLATFAAACVAVPLNPNSPVPEAVRQLHAVDPKAMMVGVGKGDHALAIAERVPSIEVVGKPWGSRAKDIDRIGVAGAEFSPTDVAPAIEAALLFTSGTSGEPRAAALSHGNLLATQQQLRSLLETQASGDNSSPVHQAVALLALPLFHIYALNLVLNSLLAVASTIVMLEEFHAADMLAAIDEHQPTVLPGVPPMWAALAAARDVSPERMSSIRFATSGASHLPLATYEAVRDRLGLTISEGYGLTETGGLVTSSLGNEVKPGSVGRPLPGVQMRLVDEGVDVPVGDRGEVWVRGDNVTGGYWQDLDATGRSITSDGWLRTGDIGVVDDDGYLYLVDRSKDMIIVSGFNVFPAEVEEVLMSIPTIEHAIVVGEDDDRTGETVVAHVQLAEDSDLTADYIKAFCRDYLARYKTPSRVEIVDELPATLTGKRLRRMLKTAG
ncbi:MAG: long-chain fatty acid--CoA ligase [Actinomycetia bacterium]|nr:long-chain fatty acid--CoA ligase [Actinomycetes bacterium]MCP4961495.1 long-chain fatty acid--CoA ligase [Actinomycetes bacterium]